MARPLSAHTSSRRTSLRRGGSIVLALATAVALGLPASAAGAAAGVPIGGPPAGAAPDGHAAPGQPAAAPDEAAGLILTVAPSAAGSEAASDRAFPSARALQDLAAAEGVDLQPPEQVGPSTYVARSAEVLSGNEARALARRASTVAGISGAYPNYRYDLADSPAAPAAPIASATSAAATASASGAAPAAQAAGTPDPQPAGSQAVPPWNLDRIDQRSGTNMYYRYDTTGAGVLAYLVDTGIRASHKDFGGRVSGGVAIVPGATTDDCIGHGTHVAGILGGADYGVAKGVTLVPVNVTDCTGAIYAGDFIDALYWVASHHTTQPAVLNSSIGGPALEPVDAAVRAVIADGVTFVAASGNSAGSACDRSPSRVPEVISVNSSTKTDARSDFSNLGACTDIYAPGEDVLSAGTINDSSSLLASGTSMAAPHVAGAVARHLQNSPKSSPAVAWWVLAVTSTPIDPAPWDPSDSKKLLFVHAPVEAPVITSVAVGDGSASVAFTQPPTPGGPPITTYQYNLHADVPGSPWVDRSPAGTSSPLQLTGLTNGATYRVSMRAVTTEYPGKASGIVAFTPAIAPGVPTGLSATAGDAAAWIGFTAPSDGGARISTYQFSLDDGATWLDLHPAQPTPPVLVTGLANGVAHTIRLRAVNVIGAGPASAPVSVTPQASADALFVPLSPQRAVDTRSAGGPVSAGHPRAVDVSLGGLVPAEATAVVYNLTVTGQTSSGFASVTAGGVADSWTPTASTINWIRSLQTMANGHVSKLGADRTVKVFVGGSGTAHIVLDVTGYFLPAPAGGASQAASDEAARGAPNTPGAIPPPVTSAFVPVGPVRAYSSIGGDGPIAGPTSLPRRVDLSDVLPAGATAVAYNLTITGTNGSGYLALAPAGGSAPGTSAINWGSRVTIANASIVPVSDQAIDVFIGGSGNAHFLIDVVGYFVPPDQVPVGAAASAFHPLDALRAYDSRTDAPVGQLAAAGSPRTTGVDAGGTVPDSATAVAYNLTATGNTGTGYLAVGPDPAVFPGASALNWTPATSTIANGSTVGVDPLQQVSTWAGGGASHYLIDLAGYYTPLAE